MTDSAPLVTGFHNALPILVSPLIENRFWTLLIDIQVWFSYILLLEKEITFHNIHSDIIIGS